MAGKKNSNNSEFQLWRQDNHPLELTTPEIAHQKLDYLHYNPVEAGLCRKAGGLFIQQRNRLLYKQEGVN